MAKFDCPKKTLLAMIITNHGKFSDKMGIHKVLWKYKGERPTRLGGPEKFPKGGDAGNTC